MIDEDGGTDEKAAKKCFHVLATSLEALSTIRQHCQDMEALFSDFHIGNVGVGVVENCLSHWLGCCSSPELNRLVYAISSLFVAPEELPEGWRESE